MKLALLGIAPDYTAMQLECDHHGRAMQGYLQCLEFGFSVMGKPPLRYPFLAFPQHF
jgi:hypothetical protein